MSGPSYRPAVENRRIRTVFKKERDTMKDHLDASRLDTSRQHSAAENVLFDGNRQEASLLSESPSESPSIPATQPSDSGAQGLRFRRRYTRPGIHPFDEIEWEMRPPYIVSDKGTVIIQ